MLHKVAVRHSRILRVGFLLVGLYGPVAITPAHGQSTQKRHTFYSGTPNQINCVCTRPDLSNSYEYISETETGTETNADPGMQSSTGSGMGNTKSKSSKKKLKIQIQQAPTPPSPLCIQLCKKRTSINLALPPL
jgi:hypothetical protein